MTTHIDYYGNIIDDKTGASVGQVPYEQSEMGKRAIAANQNLQSTVQQYGTSGTDEGQRAIADAMAAYNGLSRPPAATMTTSAATAGDTQDPNQVQWPLVGDLTLKAQDGSMHTLRHTDYATGEEYARDVAKYTSSGWTPLNEGGKPYKIVNYKGGEMYLDPDRPDQAFPLNELMGGQKTPAQQAAMADFWASQGKQPPPPKTNVPGGPAPITPPTPPTLTGGNVADRTGELIKALLGRTGMTDSLAAGFINNLYPSLGQLAGDTATWRNDILNQFIFGEPETPGMMQTLKDMLAKRNEATGLTAQTKAALNSQAMDQIPQRYNAASSALKTELARRGAVGNQMPGSMGDILRGYEPLMNEREMARAEAERAGIFANENAMQTSLQQNRQNALSASGLMGGMVNTLGQIYNPNPIIQQMMGAGGLGLSALNSTTGSYDTMANMLNAQAGNQQASLGQIALASLISSLAGGGSAGGGAIGAIINKIPWDKIFGGGGTDNTGTDTGNGQGGPYDPFASVWPGLQAPNFTSSPKYVVK